MIKLTDIKWINTGIAAALERAGVTVQMLAEMDGDELLNRFPFVGTINAWLLTEEARYIMEQAEAGLWDPQAKLDLEMTLEELDAIEREATMARIRPLMEWPPAVTPQADTGKSVRVRRIEAQQAKQAQLDAEREQLQRLILEQDETEEAE